MDFDQEAQRINYSIERIVYATDFLESSRLALDYAIGFAHQYDATLVMVHVVELSPAAQEVEAETGNPCLSRKAAHDRLDAFAAGVRRLGIKVELDLRDGAVSETVIESAEANRADLLVLGTHGIHRGLDHMLVGSNTERILLIRALPDAHSGPARDGRNRFGLEAQRDSLHFRLHEASCSGGTIRAVAGRKIQRASGNLSDGSRECGARSGASSRDRRAILRSDDTLDSRKEAKLVYSLISNGAKPICRADS